MKIYAIAHARSDKKYSYVHVFDVGNCWFDSHFAEFPFPLEEFRELKRGAQTNIWALFSVCFWIIIPRNFSLGRRSAPADKKQIGIDFFRETEPCCLMQHERGASSIGFHFSASFSTNKWKNLESVFWSGTKGRENRIKSNFHNLSKLASGRKVLLFRIVGNIRQCW